jgi:outer membrane receptor protein involved in Fe transport
MLQTRGFSDEVGFAAGNATSVSRAGGEARDLSLFVQDNWLATTKLSLSLSARFDVRRNLDAISTTRTLATGSVVETRFPDRRDPSFSPRVAATYDVSDAIAIYAAFARSFRAPSLNELYRGFRVGNIVTEANAFLTPERSNTIEAGGSLKLFNPTTVLRASVFSTRVSDPIVSVTTSALPTLITRQRQNVGSTTSRGFESDAQIAPKTGSS